MDNVVVCRFPNLVVEDRTGNFGSQSFKLHTLGLIGGMNYHSTALYYTEINNYVAKETDGKHSAEILLYSFGYGSVMAPFHAGDYDEVSRRFVEAGRNLKLVGAKAIVLCANTAHKWAGDIGTGAGIPILHIIDFTGEAIRKQGLKKVALLGTKITLTEPFLKDRLHRKYEVEILLPREQVMDQMDVLIYGDLSKKIVTEETKRLFLDMVEELVKQGAEGVILGCTELQFVLKPGDMEIPLFDTVALHATGAAQWAMSHQIEVEKNGH